MSILDGLKQDLARQSNAEFVTEATVKHTVNDDSSIKDAFLDDPEFIILGAEDDPEIAKLVNAVPEYNDGISEKELEQLEESYFPETNFIGGK